MDRAEFDRIIRERYTENPDHLRSQAQSKRRIAQSIRARGGVDAHGNRAETWENLAARDEAKAERLS